MNMIEDAALAAVPGVGWGSKLKLALKFAPMIAIAVLVGILLWQRGTVNKLSGERDLAVQNANALGAVVVADNKTIEGLTKRQIDNDAIAAAVAERLESNRAQTEGQRQAIRNATNEPTVRTWANQPIPDSVRRILENSAPASH